MLALNTLAPAEKKILALLVVKGSTNREIAERMRTTTKFVKFKMYAIYNKLGIRTARKMLVTVYNDVHTLRRLREIYRDIR